MTAFVAVICGLIGCNVGSFLNVVIWRVPRGLSVVSPPSHCPGCEQAIAPYDNIPILSWLVLRGRCRRCGIRISGRYPLVEALTGLVFAAVGWRFGADWPLPAYLLLAGGLIALSAIDLELMILPTRIVVPLGTAGLALLAVASWGEGDWGALGRAVVAAAVSFTGFRLLHLVKPGGMGYGDVRLSAVLGLNLGWLGWGYVPFGLFAGFLYGAVFGIALLAVRGREARRTPVPFGPFLAAGTMTLVLVGAPILDWYGRLGT
ncbi:MAG: prepilin peptidase [Actinomycetota bacterium]